MGRSVAQAKQLHGDRHSCPCPWGLGVCLLVLHQNLEQMPLRGGSAKHG